LCAPTRALSSSKLIEGMPAAVASPMLLALRSGMPNRCVRCRGPSVRSPNDRIYAGYGAICVRTCTVSWVTTRHVIPQQLLLTRLSRFRRSCRELCVALSSVHKLPSACLPWAPGRQLVAGTSLRTGYQSAAAQSVRVLSAVGSITILPEGMAFLENVDMV
jgi:hypothetical protein